MISSDFLLCSIRDKKTGLLGNVVMARNEVELERDLYRVVTNSQSPYKDFECDYEVCILGNYNLVSGIVGNIGISVYKDLSDIKNMNMNDKEAVSE